MPLDNSIGGAGAAPGSFAVLNQYPDTLILASGQAVEAVTIEAQTVVYAVWYMRTVTQNSWDLAAGIVAAGAGGASGDTPADQLMGEYAAVIESFAMLAPVSDIYYQRDTNPRGLFVDQLVVTVGLPGVPPGTGEVVVSLDPAKENVGNNAILAAWAGVQKVATVT